MPRINKPETLNEEDKSNPHFVLTLHIIESINILFSTFTVKIPLIIPNLDDAITEQEQFAMDHGFW